MPAKSFPSGNVPLTLIFTSPFLNTLFGAVPSVLKMPSPVGSPTSMLGNSAFATSWMTGAWSRIQMTRNWCLPRMSNPGVSPLKSIRAAPLMTAIPGLSDETWTEKQRRYESSR